MTDRDKTDAVVRGMGTRRTVLGGAHVDRSEARKSAFDADFRRCITDVGWGSLWSRPGLSLRERSMSTMALLAAPGHQEELAMRARATAATGASVDDIGEALLHVAVYAGVPAANRAFGIVKGVLEGSGCDTEGAAE